MSDSIKAPSGKPFPLAQPINSADDAVISKTLYDEFKHDQRMIPL